MSVKEERAEKKAERKERVPIGGHRLKLHVETRPGYVGRWVNDTPGRLEEFLAAGYEFITDPRKVGDTADVSDTPGIDSRISRRVDVKPDGTPLVAYYMEQKEEWYEEDQLAKRRNLEEKEEALRRGQDEQGKPGSDGRYVPVGTPIKIEHGKGPA